MKKKIILSLILILVLCFNCVSAEEIEITSKSSILIDANNGQILFEKNSHEKLPPASITKIMTMLLTMEAIDRGQIDFDDEVTISEEAANMGGSQLYLEPYEIQTVDALLTGVAVESANDAAVALGEYIAGSHIQFVDLMNQRAKELGMEDTHFANANGLPDPEHYTSAYDIALMSKELLKYSNIHSYLTIWMKDISVGKEKDKIRTLANTNKLLKMDSKVDGIKTGYTSEARYCLSATAKTGDFRLISVILNASSSKVRFEEADQLLNYGFNTFKKINIVKKDELFGEVKVIKGQIDKVEAKAAEEFSVILKKIKDETFDTEIFLNESIKAPIAKGQKLGEISIKNQDNQIIGKVDLVSDIKVQKVKFFNLYSKLLKNWISKGLVK